MESSKPCGVCGQALAAGSPEGLCAACLLKAGLDSGVDFEAGTLPGSQPPRFTAPAIAELSKLFPLLEIQSLLGQGGMGAVYQARQPALDRWVALKVLPDQPGANAVFSERFAREARALARLNHPNIVGIYDYGHVEGFCYFLMEFVEGVSLRQLLQTGHLPPQEALRIIPQICDALQYAHDQGVVHRDIKPENVLMSRAGQVKIADFGLAKTLGVAIPAMRLTGEGQVMGTPHYMAPEQVEHPAEVDHRADIFSLGVVFYEMLTGELPLGRFPLPSAKVGVDVQLDSIVLRALEKRPELRYQRASEVKTSLETAAAPTGAKPGKTNEAAAKEAASAPSASPGWPGTVQPWRILAILLPFFAPPVAFFWFLLGGHEVLGLDLDADVEFFVGLIGLPISAGLGLILAGSVHQLFSPLGAAGQALVDGKRRPWSGWAVGSIVLSALALPVVGGAAVLVQLVAREQSWNPHAGELTVSLALMGGTILLALGAALCGVTALREIRHAGGFPRGRVAALASVWLWPTLLVVGLLVSPVQNRLERQLRDSSTGRSYQSESTPGALAAVRGDQRPTSRGPSRIAVIAVVAVSVLAIGAFGGFRKRSRADQKPGD